MLSGIRTNNYFFILFQLVRDDDARQRKKHAGMIGERLYGAKSLNISRFIDIMTADTRNSGCVTSFLQIGYGTIAASDD